MTSESDESWMYDYILDSPADYILDSPADDNSNVRELKKGQWTSAEDAILVAYVEQNGEGNWNAVQKHTGLARCGKSCRLRWTNHLRPHLKKGPFSPEEEQLIVELHAKWGNKWAKMALELPGRTDNEIKNFWNTRVKRLQRAGLPIYPPGITVQDESQQSSSNMSSLSSQDTYNPDFDPFNNNFHIPPVEFKSLKLDDDNLYLDPNNYLLARGPLPILPATSFLASDYSFSSLNAVNDASIHMGPSPYGSIQMGQSHVYSSPYDHNFTTDHNASSVVFGSHAGLYGNSSSSEPDWAMQNELPSLQTQMGSSWGPHSSPLPSFESFGTSIQNPPPTQNNTLSYNNRNSGLLDAVIGGSQTMQSPLSHASNVEVDTSQTSSRDFYNMERDPYSEQISPFSNSYSSVFSGSTPISRSSFDEHESLERGGNVQEQTTILDPNQMIFPRPDMLLGSNWAGTDYSKMYQNQDLRDSNR